MSKDPKPIEKLSLEGSSRFGGFPGVRALGGFKKISENLPYV